MLETAGENAVIPQETLEKEDEEKEKTRGKEKVVENEEG